MKLALALFASASTVAFGVRTPAAPAPESTPAPAAAAVDPVKVEPYALKNRSNFNFGDDARAPFWPIGMKKRPEAAPAPVAVKAGPSVVKPKISVFKAEYFVVTGVLLGRSPLATLNGRSFAEGEKVPVIFDGQRIDLQMRSIRDGGVFLAQGENVFFVALRRPEPGSVMPATDANPQNKVLNLDESVGAKKPR